MKTTPFAIERYFSRYEFNARHLLSSSDCQALTLREVLAMADGETRALWDGLSLGYTESTGLPLLRQEIAGLYTGVGAHEVFEIVPEEGILLAMNALLQPGDHVVATFPGYQSLYQIARDRGCEVSCWEPIEARGWHFDVEALKAAMRPSTRLVVVNFPHNPTGALISRGQLEEVVKVVADHGAYLFCDEMYRHLESSPGDRLPSAVELSNRAVVLSGLSKSFSAPGLRVGWLVTHDAELLARVALGKDYTTICGSAPSEILALMVLRARGEIVARNLELVRSNLAAFTELVARHGELLSSSPPRAGSTCFPRLTVTGGATAFCARLVEETGVMLLPSTVFDYGDEHIRVGLGRRTFVEGLAVLEQWLERHFSK